jgi:hypothetical protein
MYTCFPQVTLNYMKIHFKHCFLLSLLFSCLLEIDSWWNSIDSDGLDFVLQTGQWMQCISYTIYVEIHSLVSWLVIMFLNGIFSYYNFNISVKGFKSHVRDKITMLQCTCSLPAVFSWFLIDNFLVIIQWRWFDFQYSVVLFSRHSCNVCQTHRDWNKHYLYNAIFKKLQLNVLACAIIRSNFT